MTGLKSGSGDDLWGDDGDEDEDDVPPDESEADSRAGDAGRSAKRRDERDSGPDESGPNGADPNEADGEDAPDVEDDATTETDTPAPDDGLADVDSSTTETGSAAETEPTTDNTSYIVRRAVQDKSVQFERDERLTFFVHDDVADGERDLITDLQSQLGRDVPKFDVREAVYRAALRNPDDVLEELLEMGYTLDEA